jgi:dUTP pyrophosphatase
MMIEIQKLDDAAIVPEIAHAGDAGMDLFSIETLELAPHERRAIKTGIALAIPDGYVGLVWDKSGRALKDGLTTLAGVIDSSYRGEVQVVLLNVADNAVTITAGEKIAQLLIQPVIAPTLQVVETLSDTTRGSGGFGSTGITQTEQ